MWNRVIRFVMGLALLAMTGSVALAGAAATAASPADGRTSPQILDETPLVIAAGETVEDDLVVLNDKEVMVHGTLKGDLIVLGSSVTINGTVEGDLIGLTENVRINGTVLGDVRVASFGTVTIDGTVGRSLTTMATRVVLDGQGRVGTSWIALGGDVDLRGDVGRGVWANLSSLTVAGRVGRDLTVLDYEAVTLESTAQIQGSLVARGPEEPLRQPGAQVGAVRYTPVASQAAAPPLFGVGLFAILRIVGFAAAGLLLVWLAPGLSRSTNEQLSARFWLTLGVGAALLIGVPVVAVVLAITGAGLPAVLLVLLPLYAAGLYLGQMLVAGWIGQLILARIRHGAPVSRLAAFLLGMICLTLAVRLPVVRGVAGFLSLALALGSIVLVLAGQVHRAAVEQ